MSSWSDGPSRSRILRGVDAAPANISTIRTRAARELVVDPQLVVEATDEGYQRGYHAGFQAGLEDAADAIASRERVREEQVQRLVAQLGAEAHNLAARRAPDFQRVEDQVVHAAFLIARELIGFELSHAEQVGRAAIARALDLAPAGATIVVTLGPEDAAAIGDPASLAPGRAVEVVVDPALSPGDCIVDDASCRVEARLDDALARVARVLTEQGHDA